jgi:anti-sigma factor ChrR (cupin superfamily)
MVRHQNVTDEVQELASTYAFGLLEAPQSAEFEQHLSGCEICQSEVDAFREAVGALACTAPDAQPSPQLRERVLSAAAPHRVLVRADEGAWAPTPFAGIEIRRLFVDKVTGAVTSLLRVAAGAVYPAHRHGGVEHVYVIDGDLIFNDHTLETGDYEVNAGASDHSSITTKTGCLALVIHHMADKVFL